MLNSRLTPLAAIVFFALGAAGCSGNCDRYCSNQGRFISGCLEQFDQEWTDLAAGEWNNRSQFVGACGTTIDAHVEEEIEAVCTAEEGRADCENTIRQGIETSCSDELFVFDRPCSEYFQGFVEFEPEQFIPSPPEPGDDDDDDSAGDDDDSAGDDDDSAGDDDDAADDDDSAGDDDDDADDDDSAGDDDDAADDDDSATGDDDDSGA